MQYGVRWFSLQLDVGPELFKFLRPDAFDFSQLVNGSERSAFVPVQKYFLRKTFAYSRKRYKIVLCRGVQIYFLPYLLPQTLYSGVVRPSLRGDGCEVFRPLFKFFVRCRIIKSRNGLVDKIRFVRFYR